MLKVSDLGVFVLSIFKRDNFPQIHHWKTGSKRLHIILVNGH